MEKDLIWLLLVGVTFHLIYSWSIFDIYFRSPLVHGMPPTYPPTPAPARRLVLFVADGLRADKLFENQVGRAPFLQDIVLNKGTWGISHTRVPTESRPGHVAIIAGFYEDVSAVTKGWKKNPVEFDSLFNQSRITWSFGSPDILPMFAEGASDPRRVSMFMYPPEFEDFAESDASMLDTWVFDKFDELLHNVTTDGELYRLMNSDQIVIFLHLLGLDTNGHAHRPHSDEYLNNIGIVDAGIKRVVGALERYFWHDKRTAYIMTADHGMSNIGNHGDGNPQNTQTPLIAWGAGVSTPQVAATPASSGRDDVSSHWGLNNITRHDVHQADIAPLMSSLIGVPYPLNSVGVLPLSYLDNSDEYKTTALFANAKQILAQFSMKEAQKRRVELRLKEFKALAQSGKLVKEVEHLIQVGDRAGAQAKSLSLIEMSLEGLRYYQTYDWLFLRTVISFGYLGWIAFSLLFVLKKYSAQASGALAPTHINLPQSITPLFSLLAGCTFLYVKESPFQYYLYILFPIFFWWSVWEQRRDVAKCVSGSFLQHLIGVLQIGAYVTTLELLVWTYFRREILSFMLLFAMIAYPIMLHIRSSNGSQHNALTAFWIFSALSTSVFPLLSVEKVENVDEVTYGGLLCGLAGLAMRRYISLIVEKEDTDHIDLKAVQSKPLPNAWKAFLNDAIFWLQMGLVLLSVGLVRSTVASLQAKAGLPFLNQILSWAVLVASLLILTFKCLEREELYLTRLLTICLAFAPIFILLSISYETLFYVSFSCLLFGWLLMEKEICQSAATKRGDFTPAKVFSFSSPVKPHAANAVDGNDAAHRGLGFADLRVAGVFLSLINLSFFGTGNIASVSSFSLESVYRFTTIFDPFLMGALLILKLLIPFFLLSSVLRVLGHCLRLAPFSLFLLVLSTTDIMTLHFFFLVRDEGSWLEIGSTISHFVIVSVFLVFQILLYCASHVLVGRVSLSSVWRGGKKNERSSVAVKKSD